MFWDGVTLESIGLGLAIGLGFSFELYLFIKAAEAKAVNSHLSNLIGEGGRSLTVQAKQLGPSHALRASSGLAGWINDIF